MPGNVPGMLHRSGEGAWHPATGFRRSTPDLLEDAGDLRARMQGKSCFNFRQLDGTQVDALGELVRRGYERYAAEGLVGKG